MSKHAPGRDDRAGFLRCDVAVASPASETEPVHGDKGEKAFIPALNQRAYQSAAVRVRKTPVHFLIKQAKTGKIRFACFD